MASLERTDPAERLVNGEDEPKEFSFPTNLGSTFAEERSTDADEGYAGDYGGGGVGKIARTRRGGGARSALPYARPENRQRGLRIRPVDAGGGLVEVPAAEEPGVEANVSQLRPTTTSGREDAAHRKAPQDDEGPAASRQLHASADNTQISGEGGGQPAARAGPQPSGWLSSWGSTVRSWIGWTPRGEAPRRRQTDANSAPAARASVSGAQPSEREEAKEAPFDDVAALYSKRNLTLGEYNHLNEIFRSRVVQEEPAASAQQPQDLGAQFQTPAVPQTVFRTPAAGMQGRKLNASERSQSLGGTLWGGPSGRDLSPLAEADHFYTPPEKPSPAEVARRYMGSRSQHGLQGNALFSGPSERGGALRLQQGETRTGFTVGRGAQQPSPSPVATVPQASTSRSARTPAGGPGAGPFVVTPGSDATWSRAPVLTPAAAGEWGGPALNDWAERSIHRAHRMGNQGFQVEEIENDGTPRHPFRQQEEEGFAREQEHGAGLMQMAVHRPPAEDVLPFTRWTPLLTPSLGTKRRRTTAEVESWQGIAVGPARRVRQKPNPQAVGPYLQGASGIPGAPLGAGLGFALSGLGARRHAIGLSRPRRPFRGQRARQALGLRAGGGVGLRRGGEGEGAVSAEAALAPASRPAGDEVPSRASAVAKQILSSLDLMTTPPGLARGGAAAAPATRLEEQQLDDRTRRTLVPPERTPALMGAALNAAVSGLGPEKTGTAGAASVGRRTGGNRFSFLEGGEDENMEAAPSGTLLGATSAAGAAAAAAASFAASATLPEAPTAAEAAAGPAPSFSFPSTSAGPGTTVGSTETPRLQRTPATSSTAAPLVGGKEDAALGATSSFAFANSAGAGGAAPPVSTAAPAAGAEAAAVQGSPLGGAGSTPQPVLAFGTRPDSASALNFGTAAARSGPLFGASAAAGAAPTYSFQPSTFGSAQKVANQGNFNDSAGSAGAGVHSPAKTKSLEEPETQLSTSATGKGSGPLGTVQGLGASTSAAFTFGAGSTLDGGPAAPALGGAVPLFSFAATAASSPASAAAAAAPGLPSFGLAPPAAPGQGEGIVGKAAAGAGASRGSEGSGVSAGSGLKASEGAVGLDGVSTMAGLTSSTAPGIFGGAAGFLGAATPVFGVTQASTEASTPFFPPPVSAGGVEASKPSAAASLFGASTAKGKENMGVPSSSVGLDGREEPPPAKRAAKRSARDVEEAGDVDSPASSTGQGRERAAKKDSSVFGALAGLPATSSGLPTFTFKPSALGAGTGGAFPPPSFGTSTGAPPASGPGASGPFGSAAGGSPQKKGPPPAFLATGSSPSASPTPSPAPAAAAAGLSSPATSLPFSAPVKFPTSFQAQSQGPGGDATGTPQGSTTSASAPQATFGASAAQASGTGSAGTTSTSLFKFGQGPSGTGTPSFGFGASGSSSAGVTSSPVGTSSGGAGTGTPSLGFEFGSTPTAAAGTSAPASGPALFSFGAAPSPTSTGFTFTGASGSSGAAATSTPFAFTSTSQGTAAPAFKFGATATDSGSVAAPSPAFMFGSAATAASGSQPAVPFAFGSSAASSTSSQTSSIFGSSSAFGTSAPASTPFVFGSSASASSSPFVFGSSSPASTSSPFAFGATAAPASTGFAFGSMTAAPSSGNAPFQFGASAQPASPTLFAFGAGKPEAASNPFSAFGGANGILQSSNNNGGSAAMEDNAMADEPTNASPGFGNSGFGGSAAAPAQSPPFNFGGAPSSLSPLFGGQGSPAPASPGFPDAGANPFAQQQQAASGQAPLQPAGPPLFSSGTPGGFSMGAGGGAQGGRRIVKAKKPVARRK